MANREPAPWIFPSEAGKPLDYSRVPNTFRWLLRRAGLPWLRPYDLRHTHATQLLESGAPITYVALSSATPSLPADACLSASTVLSSYAGEAPGVGSSV